MVTVSLRYHFRQPLRASARAAFGWCTDFRPTDAELFADQRTRTVRRIAPGALLLTDVTRPKGRRVRIRRLVRLFPEKLAWTNTHLDGPFRNSQFWYRVVPDGPDRSHLEFYGLKLETRSHVPSAAELARLSEANCRSDSSTWRQKLAPALARDLAPRSHR